VQLPGNFGSSKINAAFSDGYMKNKDWAGGGNVAMQTVSNFPALTFPISRKWILRI